MVEEEMRKLGFGTRDTEQRWQQQLQVQLYPVGPWYGTPLTGAQSAANNLDSSKEATGFVAGLSTNKRKKRR